MTIVVLIVIVAAFLWAITNHIDKFLVNGIDESASSIETLLMFSTLVAGLVFSPIWLIICNFNVSLSMSSLIVVFLASFIFLMATYVYFKALDTNDTTIIVIMFQMIPVFSFILALIFFDEMLTFNQILGSIIIIVAAIIISIDFNNKESKFNLKALILMTLSSFLYSVYYILFDFAIRHDNYNVVAFWYQIGFLIMGIVLFCIKRFRNNFINAIKNNGKKYFSLNALNELLALGANLLENYANVTIPLALANASTGLQCMFVFILGILGTKLLPKYFNEDLNKKTIIQKTICIIVSIVGLIIMYK